MSDKLFKVLVEVEIWVDATTEQNAIAQAIEAINRHESFDISGSSSLEITVRSSRDVAVTHEESAIENTDCDATIGDALSWLNLGFNMNALDMQYEDLDEGPKEFIDSLKDIVMSVYGPAIEGNAIEVEGILDRRFEGASTQYADPLYRMLIHAISLVYTDSDNIRKLFNVIVPWAESQEYSNFATCDANKVLIHMQKHMQTPLDAPDICRIFRLPPDITGLDIEEDEEEETESEDEENGEEDEDD